ncbi:phosphoribosylformylglycinamidine synthase subunit PurL [Klenkia taihuensis]|uniref:Phosphoribosylformylglycinamidine synthase subunit PurL n=1 Tax=Klenkia taihuensis TaxID=1225127 RepID=A0A1I1IIR5_9ACTN|nr:phosphoribosylformylglycinamidine synthase subunit PurL [Klenkia taihuensis]GHE08574.1 phosphoribosylformylglycinamidine synthase subunit PurL [Klenkia taihuensis]SFC36174.1 phosphoribosylformylglycinamidine synthase [Klenkia taihuensis]
MTVDTVTRAGETPDEEQPYRELGLRDEEYLRIRDILGRRPTTAELAMYSVMWSEHCSYKSSKVHLRTFGDLPRSEALLVGMGENAGVVDVGDGYAVTFKVESHNHPSYVEPYQGAATGVGGIVRDILTMGARPVAVMDSLRFGRADAPDTARVLPGVVAGVGGYGNCLGLPNIGGEVLFDDCYAGNPLVNALCVGVMKHSDVRLAKAEGAGNKVVLFGARTGGDGIGGVSVLASETFDEHGPAKRPSVQVGDPFTEKLLIEACLEIFAADLVTGIQDLGGAGLSCATSELAAAGSGGMRIDLETVPLRDSTLTAAEILMSESQERMCAIVEPAKVEEFLAVCAKWDVLATVIGEVTDGDRLLIDWHGERIVDVPPRTVAHDGPVYERPYHRPADLDDLQADLPPTASADLRADWLAVVGSPDGCDKSWVTEQYDRYVQGNTVLAQPDDAGLVRIDETTHRGIALALDGNARFARLDPYTGAQLNLAEAYRNVAVSGAVPLAVTNCLNFGSPEEPEVMWQFAEAVRGLADGCRALGLPVTGGNVSLYNQTGDVPINPTPVIGVLGVHDDVRTRVRGGWRAAGETVLLLGETRPEFGGSAWAGVVHGHLGGLPPRLDLDAERALAGLLAQLAADGAVTSAHDLADGGLAQALTESALRYGTGATLRVDGDPTAALFAESVARAVVTTTDAAAVRAAAEAAGVPVTELGTTGGDALVVEGLVVEGLVELPLAELRRTWTRTLPDLFGHPEDVVGAVPTGAVPTS